MSSNLTLSICIPVYKGSSTLKRALNSIFRQNYRGIYEVIVLDDNNPLDVREIEKTKEIIAYFKSKKIKYYKNAKNLGSALTIRKLAHLTSGDILTFLCQDDIFSKDALLKIVNGFANPQVGVLTRPFFWFEDDYKKPIRAIYPFDKNENLNIDLLNCSERSRPFTTKNNHIVSIFNSVGQISGLAYRKKYLTRDFTDDVFPGHIYPFAEILKMRKCMFLKDYIVAVSLKTSQTRYNSKIYESSPLEAWVRMFKTVYKNNNISSVVNGRDRSLQYEYIKIQEIGIQNISTHYEGLVQIKNYGSTKSLLREIFIYLKYYPRGIFLPKFWFYLFLTVFIPRKLLIFLSDYYKRRVLSKGLQKILFNY